MGEILILKVSVYFIFICYRGVREFRKGGVWVLVGSVDTRNG